MPAMLTEREMALLRNRARNCQHTSDILCCLYDRNFITDDPDDAATYAEEISCAAWALAWEAEQRAAEAEDASPRQRIGKRPMFRSQRDRAMGRAA